jgi:hypothetical protein
LDKCKNGPVLLTNNEKIIKENRIHNNHKSKIGSPNHKLTEYFSDLKVHEHIKDDTEKEIKVHKVNRVDNVDKVEVSFCKIFIFNF